MVVTSSLFRFSRSLAPRLPHTVMLIKAEYDRAMRAARYYDNLKSRSRAEPRQLRTGRGGIPRAVFEALYDE